MLIAILVIAGVALLNKGALAIKTPVPGNGEYSLTGLAKKLTTKPLTAEGALNFTPAGQHSSVAWVLPIQLVGMDSPDPSVNVIRRTFDNEKSMSGLTGILQAQNFYSGGF